MAGLTALAGSTAPAGSAAAPAGPRRRVHRVERVMGTVVGLDVRAPAGFDPGVLERAFQRLREIDARYSPFVPTSEVSRIARGELREADASAEVRWILGLCEDLRRTTGGYFDARRHRADGRLDPSGVVKGWAIESVVALLEEAGATSFAVNAGGDVALRGEPAPGRPWRVGIRHPLRPDRVAATLAMRDGAVATSGAYERGNHVRDPHTGRPPDGLLSLTVVGPAMTEVDAYATAAFAMGRAGVAWVARRPGFGALAVTADRRTIWTPLVDALRAEASPR